VTPDLSEIIQKKHPDIPQVLFFILNILVFLKYHFSLSQMKIGIDGALEIKYYVI